MTGYHTRWVRRPEQADDPERIAIREALAFGKAVYDQRSALGLTIAELAGRAGLTTDEIECIEEGGTEAYAADQHICPSRRCPGPPPSAMRPYTPGLVYGRGRENPRTGPVGAVTPTVRPASCL